jgi:transcriptional regulator with XRE-family HTH domain
VNPLDEIENVSTEAATETVKILSDVHAEGWRFFLMEWTQADEARAGAPQADVFAYDLLDGRQAPNVLDGLFGELSNHGRCSRVEFAAGRLTLQSGCAKRRGEKAADQGWRFCRLIFLGLNPILRAFIDSLSRPRDLIPEPRGLPVKLNQPSEVYKDGKDLASDLSLHARPSLLVFGGEVLTAMPKAMSPEECRELFREVRDKTDLTLKELGRRAQLSEAMISQFENGNRDLSEEAWDRVLDAIQEFLTERQEALDSRQARLEKDAARLASEPASLILETLFPLAFGPHSTTRSGATVLDRLTQAHVQLKEQREYIEFLQERLEKSGRETARLREWLDAELVATLANEKALNLREAVHKEEAARIEQDERPLCAVVFGRIASGLPLTDAEHKRIRELRKDVERLKGSKGD